MIVHWDGRTEKPSARTITMPKGHEKCFKYARTITITLVEETYNGLTWPYVEMFSSLLQLHSPKLVSIKFFSQSSDLMFGDVKLEHLPICTSLPRPGREKRVKAPELLGGMFLIQYADCLRVNIFSSLTYGWKYYFYRWSSREPIYLYPWVEIVAIYHYVKEKGNVQYADLEDVIAPFPPHELSSEELVQSPDHDKETLREYAGKAWGWEDWQGEDI